MNSRRKPRVVIPSKFSDLVVVHGIVLNLATDGMVPVPPNGVPVAHQYLIDLAAGPNGNAASAAAVGFNDTAVLKREESENAYSDRDDQIEFIREILRSLRDYFFALHSNDLNTIGRYGFTVIQRNSFGDQKPEVELPSSASAILDLARRVDATVKSAFAVGDDGIVDSFVYSATNQTGVMLFDAITSANEFHIIGRTASEASQIATARRNTEAAKLTKFLRSARDFAFAVTTDDFGRVSELGFEVYQSTAAPSDGDDGPTQAELSAAYTSIEQSPCNVNGLVDNTCVLETFGPSSVEWYLVETVHDGAPEPGTTSSILDLASAANQLDPTLSNVPITP